MLSAAALLVLALSPQPALAATPPPPSPGGTRGKVFLTVEEALELAFPDCTVERDVVYLTEKQEERVEELAGADLESRIARPYEARDEKGKLVGTAYFDTHRVRTLRETLMIVVDPRGRIRRLEILAFAEPQDYVPPGSWYAQFLGRGLDEELNLKRAIRGVTGATLTARATTRAARRVLALHHVVGGGPAPVTATAVAER